MKKQFIATALLAAAFISCQEQRLEIEEQPQASPQSVRMTFSAQMEKDTSVTRTVLSEGNKVSWNGSDAINVFDVNLKPAQDAKFSLVTTASSGDATNPAETKYDFVGSVPESSKGYYALYPYNDYSGDDEYGLFMNTEEKIEWLNVVWAGYNQNATLGSFDPEKALLMAYTPAGNGTLTFKQVFSFIKFTVTFPLHDMVFHGYSDAAHKNEVPLAVQEFSLVMDSDGNPSITKFTKAKMGDGEINFKKNTETILNQGNDTIYPGTYLIAVMPQTLHGGFMIEFNGIPAKVAIKDNTRSTTKSVTLERGKILNLGSFSTWDFYAQGDWSGSGTENDPYLIATVDQLKLLAERVNSEKTTGTYASKYYKLLNDIDCKGQVLSSIGANNLTRFSGVFDGDGHTISNCVIGRIGYTTGLFGYLKNATIRNLSIKPAGILNMSDITSSKSYSVLAGTATTDESKYCTIDNCHVLASDYDITLTYTYGHIDYGSLLGSSYGNLRLTNCTNALSVELVPESYSGNAPTKTAIATPDLRDYYGRVGGIVGFQTCPDDVYCIIDKCRNTGTIGLVTQHNLACAGGILGSDEDDWPDNTTLRITNCMNRGIIWINEDNFLCGKNSYAGGIVGMHDSDGDSDNGDPYIYNCLNTGSVYASSYTSYSGGILGFCYDEDTDVFNCANTGSVSGNVNKDRRLGAICGNSEGTYSYCYWHSSLPLYDATWGAGSNCHGDGISASTMNSNRSHISGGTSNLVEWQGDESNLTLVF